MENDSFFTHFIVGATLLLGMITVGLILFILIGLWEAGFGTFVIVIGLLFMFSWIVHKLASSQIVKDWIKEL